MLSSEGVGSSARIEICRIFESSSEYTSVGDISIIVFEALQRRRAGLLVLLKVDIRVAKRPGGEIFWTSVSVAPARARQGLKGPCRHQQSSPRIQRRRTLSCWDCSTSLSDHFESFGQQQDYDYSITTFSLHPLLLHSQPPRINSQSSLHLTRYNVGTHDSMATHRQPPLQIRNLLGFQLIICYFRP